MMATPHQATIERQAEIFWASYFCGCGNGPAAIEAFREIMGLFDENRSGGYSAFSLSLDKHTIYEEKHGEGLTYCVLYWLEGMGLTEHGIGVRCSWMTPLGEHIRGQVMEKVTPIELRH